MTPSHAPIEPAEPQFRGDGTLYSARFEDVYASARGALEQARHVFLAGNGFPERWRRQKAFTIVETGFGAGLNFLATWQQWKATASADSRLHFVSVEKHPFRRDDLAKVYARYPELAHLTRQVFLQWPVLLPGFHRMHFEGGRLTLTLLLGDVAPMLGQLEATADAFLLDGFAPARNAEMWTPEVFAHVARLAGPGATCATYTVAGNVREGLAAVGFEVEKRPGFGSKRDMLAGAFKSEGAARPRPTERHALVIGAGLAGTTCAERLAQRGWTVDLFETHAAPAQEASGNPAGLIRPVVSADWNTHSRFTTSGYLYSTRHHAELENAGYGMTHGQGGVLQLARDAGRFEKQQRLVDAFRLPSDFLRTMQSAEASELAGMPVTGAGWWFPNAVWADPASMCRASLSACGSSVRARYGTPIASIEYRGDAWHVLDASGRSLGNAPVLVIANAHHALSFEQTRSLPLRPVRGQVSLIPARKRHPLKVAVCGDGYVTPSINGSHCVGASFNEGVLETAERVEDHAANLGRLERMLPGFGADVDAASLKGRVAFRTMARDRLPVVGPVGPEGLFACLALGSRGMTWSAIAGELLASQIGGEPLPLERDLVSALDPRRFATTA